MTKNVHKIIILGNTGDGKSTFCNYIIGEEKCKVSSKSGSETKEINGFLSIKEKNNDIMMIDTPGLSDSDGDDQKIINKIQKEIREKHCNGIKAIIIMHNFNVDRLSQESKRQLYIFSKLFPISDFWQHVAVVFSKSYENFEDFEEMKIVKLENFMPDLQQTIEKIIKDNGNKMEMPGHIQSFFTDCKKIIPGNRTDKEVDELIHWARDLNYLDIDKNDLKGQIFANCKNQNRIEDKEEPHEDKEDEKTIKVTIKHYKKYEIEDFCGNHDIFIEKECYEEEIYYLVTELGEEKGEDKKENLDDTFMMVTKKIKYWKRIDTLDRNKKLIKEGKREYYKTFDKTDPNKKIFHDKEPAETRERIVEEKETKIFESDSELQDYYKQVSKLSVGGKILFIGFNVVHFISGLVHLVTYIISKFQKKRRWKQVITHKKKILEKYVIKVDEFGNEYKQDWEKVKDIETLPDELSKPVRI